MSSKSVTITASGGAGAASGSGEINSVHGHIEAIVLKYGSAPAGTTTAISYAYMGVTETILTVTGNTDTVKRIALPTVDASNSAVTGVNHKPYIPGGAVSVAVSSADDASTVQVGLILKE